MSDEPQIIPMEEWNHSPLKFFSRYDGPFIEDTVSLGNHGLRKILEKNFEYMSRNLYFISAFGRFLLGYEREKDVIKAETIAESTINNAIKSIQDKIDKAQILLDQAGINTSMMYSKPRMLRVRITTHGAKVYAKMLMLADQFYSLNALLWMHGEIDSKAKFDNESDVRNEVKNTVRGVASQFMYILKKTRDRDEAEASKVGDHDEPQLAEAAEKVVDAETDGAMISNMDGGDVSSHQAASSSPETVETKADPEGTTKGKAKRVAVA